MHAVRMSKHSFHSCIATHVSFLDNNLHMLRVSRFQVKLARIRALQAELGDDGANLEPSSLVATRGVV